MDLRRMSPRDKGGLSWLGDESEGPGSLGGVAEDAKYGDVVVMDGEGPSMVTSRPFLEPPL